MSEKVDILAVAVHPDDIELGCSGTLLKHISKGYKVAIVDLTRGELGSRGSAEIRLEEAEKASKVLGVTHRINLGMKDGLFQNDPSHQIKVIEQIRRFQPKIVITNAPKDRHPDHGRASDLVSESCFYSGLIKITSEWRGSTQLHWRPEAVYHMIQDRYIKPDFVVDISAHFEKKMKTIQVFASQFFNPESKEPDTPISSKAFLEIVGARNRDFGRLIGAEYGEGFVVERPMGVEDILVLK